MTITTNAKVFRVLVLCTGNSARSQIAEAFLSSRGAERVAGIVVADSAGSHPAERVNPFAVEVLAAHGIKWSNHTPKSIDDVVSQHFDLVITVCDNARDACPYFPGATVQVHWGLPDPAHVVGDAAARAAFSDTYDALSVRIDALLELPIESLSPVELSTAAAAIHFRRSS